MARGIGCEPPEFRVAAELAYLLVSAWSQQQVDEKNWWRVGEEWLNFPRVGSNPSSRLRT